MRNKDGRRASNRDLMGSRISIAIIEAKDSRLKRGLW